jgi:hypothetical protein
MREGFPPDDHGAVAAGKLLIRRVALAAQKAGALLHSCAAEAPLLIKAAAAATAAAARRAGKKRLWMAAVATGAAAAIVVATFAILAASSPQPLQQESAAVSELKAPYDVFGIKRLYPTDMSGQHWDSRSWRGPARTISSIGVDPYDPYLQARGDSNTLVIKGDGTAESSGDVVRYYISDPQGRRVWKNFEFTMYSMRVSEKPSAPSYAGFAVQGRTGPGHTADEKTNAKGYPIQCDGSSYSAAIRYDGSADFKKEILWPNYTQDNPETVLYRDGVPKNTWIGMKFIVYNVNGGRDVKMELWVDRTGGVGGGDWKKVMEYVDRGGWAILSKEDAAICGYSVDEKLLEGGPSIIIRNDGVARQLYKDVSVREIAVMPAMNSS